MKLKKVSTPFLIASSLLLSVGFTFGQISTFEKTYNYGFVEIAFGLAQTADKGFVLAGTQGISFGDSRAFLTKTDSMGNEEWHQFYGYPYHNQFRAVDQTLDMGYIAVGMTSGDTVVAPLQNIYIVRVNTHGDTLWTRTFGSHTASDAALDVKVMEDSSYVILAIAHSFSPVGKSDIYLFKLNDSGELLWEQFIGDPDVHDTATKLELLDDGSFVMVGGKEVPGQSFDALITKTDSLGNVVWSKTYGWEHNENAVDIKVLPTGEYIVAGNTQSFNIMTKPDLFLLKLDSQGDTLWTKVFLGDGDSEETIWAMVAQDNEYVLMGTNYNDNEIYGTIQMQKITASGDIIWTQRISGYDNTPYSMIKTDDGGLAISGIEGTDCFSCAYLIKTNEEGSLVSIIPPPKPKETLDFQLYPNPSNGLINIRFPNSLSRYIQWSIVDIAGRKSHLPDNKVSGNTSQFQVDLSDFPKGVYFIQMYVDEGFTINKMIILN